MLPTLDTTAGQTLSPEAWALFHNVQQWLTSQRSGLGANKHIELANPRPTLRGITCDLRKVVMLDDDVRTLFQQHYDSLCGTVKTSFDDASKGNTYTVNLATSVKLPVTGGAGTGEGAATSTVFGRILDEPKALILLILLICVCAAFTTSGKSWLNLAHALHALWNPGLSRP